MKKLFYVVGLLALSMVLSCEKDTEKEPENQQVFKDGVYRAEMATFDDFDWKGFVELTFLNEVITAVDFDYLNTSNERKTEDSWYQAAMTPPPSSWASQYEQALITAQDTSGVDAISGATLSWNDFVILAQLAIEAAKEGNTNTVLYTAP